MTRKSYNDDLCDKCRVNLKDEPFILCRKCKNEWLAYGLALINKSNNKPLNKNEFEDWFKSKPKKQSFIFR